MPTLLKVLSALPRSNFKASFFQRVQMFSVEGLCPPKKVRASDEGERQRTVGLIIIGDEVLKGQVADANIHFLACRFHGLGIKLQKVSVIPDLLEDIAKEVREFSDKYDFVITTGGIGPTHDDITYEGIAAAFQCPLTLHKGLLNFWQSVYALKESKSDELIGKMAKIPEKSNIIEISIRKRVFPLVSVSNVYILPGVPSYVQLIFKELEKTHFKSFSTPIFTCQLFLKVDESQIVTALNKTVETFQGIVVIGSYPILGNSLFKTKLTFESTMKNKIEEATTMLKEQINDKWVLENGDVIWNAHRNLDRHLDSSTDHYRGLLKGSVKVVEKCFQDYSEDEVLLSFNGGKDCTALLHLVHSYLLKKHSGNSFPKIQAVYFKGKHPFKEVEEFIQQSTERYNLDLIVGTEPIKDSLQSLVNSHPKWKAVLLGTRRTDPFSKTLENFQETDHGWPKLMRVSPFLDWSYEDIWKFLLDLKVPYCSLYDQGYTSLGNSLNTKKNKLLQYTEEDGTVKYKPAYTLSDPHSERNGRDSTERK